LADLGRGVDALALAGVVGHETAVATFVISHGHPLSTVAAYDEALQQRGAFAGRAGVAVVAVGGGVGGQDGLVRAREEIRSVVYGVSRGRIV